MLAQLSEMLDRLVQTISVLEKALKQLGSQMESQCRALELQAAEMKALTQSIQQL